MQCGVSYQNHLRGVVYPIGLNSIFRDEKKKISGSLLLRGAWPDF